MNVEKVLVPEFDHSFGEYHLVREQVTYCKSSDTYGEYAGDEYFLEGEIVIERLVTR